MRNRLLWAAYEGTCLYLELARSGTNMAFTAYRHVQAGEGGSIAFGSTVYADYTDGGTVSAVIDTNSLSVYYNGNLILDEPHGIVAMTNLYRHGVFPHLEFQNYACTNQTVTLDDIECFSY